MKISETDLQNAVLQMFRDRALVAGEEVLLSRLEQFWAATTLRRGDLLDALVRCTAIGLVNIEDRDGDPYLSLTSAGAEQAQAVAPGGSWTEYLHGVLLPSLRQQRADARAAQPHTRRAGDVRPAEKAVHWPRG